MTLLDRLDSFLRDETSIAGQSVARPPLGSRAQEYLGRSVANELARIWSLDYIGEYRLSQTFNDPIDAVLDLLLTEKDRMVRCGEFPSNQNADDLYIDFIKLDHGTDVGIYIGFPDKSTKWYAYCLRMQRGGRMGSSVDSSRRITVWRMGESRQLRRERYDRSFEWQRFVEQAEEGSQILAGSHRFQGCRGVFHDRRIHAEVEHAESQ